MDIRITPIVNGQEGSMIEVSHNILRAFRPGVDDTVELWFSTDKAELDPKSGALKVKGESGSIIKTLIGLIPEINDKNQ